MPRKKPSDQIEVFNPLKNSMGEPPPEEYVAPNHHTTSRGANGRKRAIITQDMRWMVAICKTVGMNHPRIARLIGLTPAGLNAHFKAELEDGLNVLNASVAGKLYKEIENGNTGAMIFWLKTRAGWSEKTQIEQNVTINEFVDRPPRISREEWLNQYNKSSEPKLN